MKKIVAVMGAALAVVALSLTAFAAEGEELAATPPSTVSDAYVVMVADTGQVLVEKNMNKREYPASITKIMTGALALEYDRLTDLVTMTDEAVFSVPRDTTHIALTPGEEVTVEQLMYGCMMMSANDCANGLAEFTGGTIQDFVQMMNDKAQELGAVNTHFTNANGLPDGNHYTTAYDMALITRYALGVEGFRQFFGATEYVMAPTNKQPEERLFGTQSMMIVTSAYQYEGATGSKLGWTEDAHHTMVTSAQRNGVELICVVMNSTGQYEKYKDSHALLDYCFDNFQNLSYKEGSIAGQDLPLTNEAGEVTANFHVFLDPSFHLMLHKNVDQSGITMSMDVPTAQELEAGQTPTITFALPDTVDAMYTQLGTYPLTVERSVPAQETVEQPKEESLVWRVLRFVGTFLAVCLAMVLILLVILLAVRWYNLNVLHRGRRRKARPKGRAASRKGPPSGRKKGGPDILASRRPIGNPREIQTVQLKEPLFTFPKVQETKAQDQPASRRESFHRKNPPAKK